MKFLAISALVLASGAFAMESQVQAASKMASLMDMKIANHEAKQAAGAFAAGSYKALGATKCSGGRAGEYSCENVDLGAFLPHEKLGSTTREGNDLWGMFHLKHIISAKISS